MGWRIYLLKHGLFLDEGGINSCASRFVRCLWRHPYSSDIALSLPKESRKSNLPTRLHEISLA
jgi:hypothetical protein